eukprot:gene1168-2268_t
MYPNQLCWALEVEWTHARRLEMIIRDRAKNVEVKVESGKSPTDAYIIYTSCNVLMNEDFPEECYKFISRAFFIPNTCHDPEWIIQHPSLQSLIMDDAVLKVQAVPKSMEPHIIEAIIGNEGFNHSFMKGVSPENIRPSHNSHILQCIYSPSESLFHWGIISEEYANSQRLVAECLNSHLVQSHLSKGIYPVSRAYFKMYEIIYHFFPIWGWILPEKAYAMDIGASPGGWTQVLSNICEHVVSIDPGQLHPDVLALTNIRHICATAESFETQNIIKNISKINNFRICVCDVNFEPAQAVAMLVENVLVHMQGYRIPTINTIQDSINTKSSSYIILTLKLQKGPKEKHIQRAFEGVKVALSAVDVAAKNARDVWSLADTNLGLFQQQRYKIHLVLVVWDSVVPSTETT